jgi:hypothetical protein
MEYRPSSISDNIPTQIPDHYAKEGQTFVEFVKEYYQYLDNTSERNFSKIRDIDTTLEGFLKYYKKKYLGGLPFVNETLDDIPFLVKNIADLYRSKGTPEALELLFKLFYKVEIETYYPASSILSLSDSEWAFSTFIEFLPVTKIDGFPIQKGDVIEGDTTGASAFVDEMLFFNINGCIVPVGFISNVFGRFITDDGIKVTRTTGDVIYPGKLIYGSISSTNVINRDATADNKIGDNLKLISDNTGVNATARIREVSDIPTGVVDWVLKNPGWGYSTDSPSTTIYKSTQVLILSGDEVDIKPFDVVTAAAVSFTSRGVVIPNKRFDGSGVVVAYEHPIVYLDSEPETLSAPYTAGALVARDTTGVNTVNEQDFVEPTEEYNNPRTQATVTRPGDAHTVTLDVVNATRYNDSADFEIGSLNNSENVAFFSDLIQDYLSVPLDSANFNMGGRINPNNISTKIQDALGVTRLELGSIEEIKVLSSGIDYKNNVRVIMRNPPIFDLRKGNFAVTFDQNDFIISEGEIMEQQIMIEDLSQNPDGSFVNPGLLIPHIVRAQFVRREDNIFFFQPLSIYTFDNESDSSAVSFKGRTINVRSVSFTKENPSGGNAIVTGDANYLSGQIKTIDVTKSGYRYKTGETVRLINIDEDSPKFNQQVGLGEIVVNGMGNTDGSWVTKASHLSDNNRFIRDNYYYQEFSYDVSTILDVSKYEETVKNVTHVAGTKLFGTPLISTVDELIPSIDGAIDQSITDQRLVYRHFGLNLETVGYAMLLESQDSLNAAQLSTLLNTDDSGGRKFGSVAGDANSENFVNDVTNADYLAFIRYAAGNANDLAEAVVERLDQLIEKINFDAITLETSVTYNGTPYDLFLFADTGTETTIELLHIEEYDPDDANADGVGYSQLEYLIPGGSLVQNERYQIVSIGDSGTPAEIQLRWNAAANTSGITYDVGSVFVADTNGSDLGLNAKVIPTAFALLVEASNENIVDFNS